MKEVSKQVLFLAMVVATSANTWAEDKPPEGVWTGNVELGFVKTSGNTDTQTVNAKAKAETEREKWRHTLSLEALSSKDQEVTTAERYEAKGQANYKTSKQNYFYALLHYEDDRFSGYDYRVTEGIGYGRRVVEEPTLTLDLEIGPGLRQSKLDTGDTENEKLLHGAAKLAWNISKTSKFTEELTTDVGEDATVTKSVTSLAAQINGSLATKITYTIKNTSDVPVGVKKTDTETAVTLVYRF